MERLKEFNRTFKCVDDVYERYARESGFSSTVFSILYILFERGSCLQRKLHEEWYIPKQTVSTVLSNLEKEGLVRREFKEGSRKDRKVICTQKGRELLDRMIAPLCEAEERALSALGRREYAALIKGAQNLKDLLQKEIAKIRKDDR